MDLGLMWQLDLAPQAVTEHAWTASGGMGAPQVLVRTWMPAEEASQYLVWVDVPYALRLEQHLVADQMALVMSTWRGMSWRDRFAPEAAHTARHGGVQSLVLTSPATRAERSLVRSCLDFLPRCLPAEAPRLWHGSLVIELVIL